MSTEYLIREKGTMSVVTDWKGNLLFPYEFQYIKRTDTGWEASNGTCKFLFDPKRNFVKSYWPCGRIDLEENSVFRALDNVDRRG